MSLQALAARIEAGDAPLVLDVRTPQEFAVGHIPGTVNLPHDELADRIGELSIEQSGEVIVHCQRGVRASEAEDNLRNAGFTKVLDMEGQIVGPTAALADKRKSAPFQSPLPCRDSVTAKEKKFERPVSKVWPIDIPAGSSMGNNRL